MKKRAPRKSKFDDKSQSQAFIKKAREIDADQKHSSADRLLGALAKTPPAPRKSKS